MAERGTPLQKLASAFNEGNETLRSTLLEECWAEEACYLEDGAVLANGRERLAALIKARRADPRFYVKLGSLEQAEGIVWGRWQVRRVHQPVAAQDVVARLDADGKLRELTAMPAAPSREGGKLLSRIVESAIENPIPAVGLFGGTLYLALRIPVGLFYGDLGVTPDEVGFGPEVLVPQSLTLLAAFLLAMLLLSGAGVGLGSGARIFMAESRLRQQGKEGAARAAAGIVVFALVCSVVVGRFLGPCVPGNDSVLLSISAVIAVGLLFAVGLLNCLVASSRIPGLAAEVSELKDQARRREVRRDILRTGVVITAIYGSLGLLVVLPIWALADAHSVRSGGIAGGRMMPWRALPVHLHWADEAMKVRLTNSCRVLRLLGVGNGQTIVFDTRLDRVFRIPVADASVSVRRDCA